MPEIDDFPSNFHYICAQIVMEFNSAFKIERRAFQKVTFFHTMQGF